MARNRSRQLEAVPRSLTIEGYSPDEILSLPDELADAIVFTGEPFVFHAGSAEVLGEFRIAPDRLVIELAQIDGGGEGVLLTLWMLARRYAARKALARVEWIVHAVTCVDPNLKLRRMLDRRGFEVREVADSGQAYWLMDELANGSPS
ncbi:MAG: hypothetical protein Rubg2KO_23760 [Rubricoccaceae bacterium]